MFNALALKTLARLMPFKALAGQKKSLSAKTLRNVKALLICLRCTEPGYNDVRWARNGKRRFGGKPPGKPSFPYQKSTGEGFKIYIASLVSWIGLL